MAIPVLLGFTALVAILAPFLRRGAATISIASSAIVFATILALPWPVEFRTPWIPTLGIDFSFSVDAWAALFLLLISGIGVVIKGFAAAYLPDRQPEFYGKITLFELAMLGLVSANDLVTLFLFWELTTLASYGLIRWKGDTKANKAALRAWWTTGLPGLVMLVGLIGLKAEGIHQLSDLGGATPPLWALICILLGALAKSAQVPLHFWLPGAMTAPAPVSAYLHSATMVKAGVYLVGRLVEPLQQHPAVLTALMALGLATLLWGGWLSLFQSDLKKLLAYTTVATLGTLIFLLGCGTPTSVHAAVSVVLFHALYKSSLFLSAGVLEKKFSAKSLDAMSGIAASMPWLAAVVWLSGLSMIGVPPFGGFVAKEVALKAIDSSSFWFRGFALGQVCIGASWVALAWRLKGPGTPKAAPLGLQWPLIPAAAGLALAFFLHPLANRLLEPAAQALLPGDPKVGFELWHGWTLELAVSAGIVAGAFALGLWFSKRTSSEAYATNEGLLQRFLDQLIEQSQWLTARVQTGSLRRYLKLLLLTAALSVAVLAPPLAWIEPAGQPDGIDLLLFVLAISSAWAACVIRTRLGAILTAGGVGVVMTALFALYSAPDLALTNLIVEVLTVLVFAVMLSRLPKVFPVRKPSSHYRDLAIGLGAGLVFAGIVYACSSPPFGSQLSEYFVANSPTGAKAQNVVNAILVDFRGIDTFGEIAVLLCAAVGASFLLGRRSPASSHAKEPQA